MEPASLNRTRIQAFLALAADRLEGEWLLVGGGLAALWLRADRTTEDIDLIGLGGTAGERLALMDLALEAGLPIEAVNSAADYFVRQVADWTDHLEVLLHGRNCVIWRPDSTLFVLLKLGRLSEKDFGDINAVLDVADSPASNLDRERLLRALDALPPTELAEVAARRGWIRARVAARAGGGATS